MSDESKATTKERIIIAAVTVAAGIGLGINPIAAVAGAAAGDVIARKILKLG